MGGVPLGDDEGIVASTLCPLCPVEGWCVAVDLSDLPWPEADLAIAEAIEEHLDEHLPDWPAGPGFDV